MMNRLRSLDDILGLILHDGAKIMFFLFAAVVVIICRSYQQLAIPHPYSLDYGEAPLVDHAMRLTWGENIYRADISEPPYTITNYPPLYMALIALGVQVAGPESAFFFGRMISALCSWIAAFCILFIVFAHTRDRIASLAAGAVFLAFPYVVFWSPLLRIDMLALALSLCGLLTLVWKPESRIHFIAAGLLLIAAIYTRQSYALAAPLAAFVWLLARDWKQALRFAALVGGLSVLLFLILNIATGGGFFYNIVTANVNEFRMQQVTDHWERLLEIARTPVWFGVVSLLLPLSWLVVRLIERFSETRLVLPGTNPLWTLAAPYLLGSLVSAATIGKVGSNVNYLLELCAGLGLAAGVVIAWARASFKIHALQAVVLFTLALGVARLMSFMMLDYSQDLLARRSAITELHQLKALVKETPGEILADEYMGMLTLLGRPLVIQPFEVTQLSLDGQWDQKPLLQSIRNREYAAIILYDQPWSINDRWTPEMREAVLDSYVLVDVIAQNRVYKAFQPVPVESIESCPGSKWRLPSDGSLGVQWNNDVLDFFGRSTELRIPVYAVADGLLTRPPNWSDAVAILHEDPNDPRKKIWAVYGGMAEADGESLISEEFPVDATKIPVKSGQLLGYQGTWSGTPQWPMWKHASFLVFVDLRGMDTFPSSSTSVTFRDPAEYLGLSVDKKNKNPQPVKCE